MRGTLDRVLVVLGCALVVATVAVAATAGTNGTRDASTAKSGGAPTSTNRVAIKNFTFAPSRAEVKTGTRVTFSNGDSAEHTATSDQGATFDTGTVNHGQSKSVIISKPGTYAYHCDFHPYMKATVTVR